MEGREESSVHNFTGFRIQREHTRYESVKA